MMSLIRISQDDRSLNNHEAEQNSKTTATTIFSMIFSTYYFREENRIPRKPTDEARSQLLIQSCFVFKVTKLAVNDPKSRAIDKTVVEMITLDAIGKQFLVKKMIGDCKKIVGLMNRSDPARKTFKVIQREIDIKKLPLRLLRVANSFYVAGPMIQKSSFQTSNIIEATGIKKLDNMEQTNKKPIESQKQKCLKFNGYLEAISSSEGSAEDIDENP
uniref:Uncharacterized protein n=1 Tax=Romanomermis culicivorax TaxID=13658 RepID=A0A915L4W2_ROMCU